MILLDIVVLSVVTLPEDRRERLVIITISLMIILLSVISVVTLPVKQTVVSMVADSFDLIASIEQIDNPTPIQAQLAALGPTAPVGFVLLQALQVIIAPIPGQILAGVAGAFFGVLPGTVYSLIGVVAGSTIVFIFTRRIGRRAVQRLFDPDQFSRWDESLTHNEGGILLLFAAFLLPTFPDDLLCFAAGLSDIRLRTFILLVLTGRAPTFALAAYAGSNAINGQSILVITIVSIAILLWTLIRHYRYIFINWIQ